MFCFTLNSYAELAKSYDFWLQFYQLIFISLPDFYKKCRCLLIFLQTRTKKKRARAALQRQEGRKDAMSFKADSKQLTLAPNLGIFRNTIFLNKLMKPQIRARRVCSFWTTLWLKGDNYDIFDYNTLQVLSSMSVLFDILYGTTLSYRTLYFLNGQKPILKLALMRIAITKCNQKQLIALKTERRKVNSDGGDFFSQLHKNQLYQSILLLCQTIILNMNSFDWQKAWERRYSNTSDDKWKTKSLNPMQSESYEIKLPQKQASAAPANKSEGGQRQQQELLPSPTLTKINQTMFCISLERQLNLFYLMQDDKSGKKSKKIFSKVEYKVTQKISKITGLTFTQGDRLEHFVLIGTADTLLVLKIHKVDKDGTVGYRIDKEQEQHVSVPDFRNFLCFGGNRIVAFSSTHLYEFELVDDKLKEVVTKKIVFNSKEDGDFFRSLTPIGIVAGYGKSFYYFGSKEDNRLDVNKIKGAEDNPRPGRCEALTIVKLQVTGTSDIQGIAAEVYPIDYIFQPRMFNRTKIFEIEKDTFLFSLHEEIVLVKKNFNRYIVWDNVSVVSSKSQSKKGQLILIAQTILVYSEPAEIFAHEIFFEDIEKKLKMPTIDNFKGNDTEELVLYDALMLSTEDSIMKVLVYTKQVDVIYPANSSPFRPVESDPNKVKQSPKTLDFTILCISQNDPKKKLETLISQSNKSGKPTTQQINDFCERFKISPQDLTKGKWNVSNKKQKDIESILMQIKDDDFIKAELDNILKQESHDLTFLAAVEKKQFERLKGILIEKIVQYTRNTSKQPKDLKKTKELKEYIFGILKWMMESEMFKKKVNYSLQFLSFKEYDFIEIGKLRAASLKEEIKLLSEKKYVKRLKHFINQFKNLVISNFEQVFTFLLNDKSVSQIQNFILEFPFILPKFHDDSQVFIQRKNFQVISKNRENNSRLQVQTKRERTVSFNAGTPDEMPFQIRINERSRSREKITHNASTEQKDLNLKESRIEEDRNANETRCLLWEEEEYAQLALSYPGRHEGQQEIPETLEVFLKKTSVDIRSQQDLEFKEESVKNLDILLEEFQTDSWFKVAAFKQHCMVTKTSRQIKQEFNQLKKDKSFLILIKFLYGRITGEKEGNSEQVRQQKQDIRKLLSEFIRNELVPQSFVSNVYARIKVYDLLKPLARPNPDKKTVTIELTKFQEFLVKSQPDYFAQIFQHIRPKILDEVMKIYDDIEKGFFGERFGKFLTSDRITPEQAIDFLDEFTEELINANEQRAKEIDKVRFEVFNAIKKLLKLCDKENTKKYVIKSLDKAVLLEAGETQTDKLKDEAKIPYGSYFYHLFVAFDLSYTYQELINFTCQANIDNNQLIKDLVEKYCREQYLKHYDEQDKREVCYIEFEDFGVGVSNEKLPKIDIHNEPLQFFGVVLMLIGNLDFMVEQYILFELMLQNYLNVNKFKELSDFINKMQNYHITENNINTKNYQIIQDFKQYHDIAGMFAQYTLSWVKRKYDAIAGLQGLDDHMSSVERALNMLQVFYKDMGEIKKERALFILLTYLKNFQPQIVANVEEIKKEATSNTGFVFLMHMFKKIGVQKFTATTQEEDHPTKVENFFRIFEAHQQYVKGEKVDYFHPEFIRFLIQVCFKMIESNQFHMARFLILYKIPNETEYFLDVVLAFLAASKRKGSNFNDAVIKQILTPETTSLIKNNLESLIMKYEINGFIPTKPAYESVSSTVKMEKDQSKSMEDRPEERLEFYGRCSDMFRLAMSKYRKQDAFFFLARVKLVRNDSVKKVAQDIKNFNISSEQQAVEVASFFMVTSYIKALQLFVQKEFYPTYRFFESKLHLLTDGKARMDVIKDINIAMSKLQKSYSKEKNRLLFDLKNELEGYYNEFMSAIGQDPEIRLVDSQAKGATASLRAEVYARSNTLAKEQEQMKKELNQHKKKINQNIHKEQELKEAGKFNILNKNINEQIAEIRKTTERHALLQANFKKEKDGKQPTLAERKAKELEQIKQKERDDIQSIKDTYKSNTTKRVTDLIENLRKKREEVKQKTFAPTSAVREDQDNEHHFGQSNTFRNPSEKQNPITRPSQISRAPQIPQIQQFPIQTPSLRPQIPLQPPQSFSYRNEAEQVSYTQQLKKANFQDIEKLYKQKENEEALKCIKKYEILKNASVRGQLIKRAYSVTNNLDSFLQFLKFLIDSDATWKESVEQKSIPIATQMLKMEPKQKITIKQIIPVQLFTKVEKMSVKDYYPVAFETFKPKLIKILEKDLMAVHAVGILFRYALGSENRFYNKVFYEYFIVLLSNYELKNYEDKELTMLAQKLRSNYSNLPDSKTENLERLLQKVSSAQKKNRLLQTLMKILERKGESLVGGQSNKQIALVVQKLMKNDN